VKTSHRPLGVVKFAAWTIFFLTKQKVETIAIGVLLAVRRGGLRFCPRVAQRPSATTASITRLARLGNIVLKSLREVLSEPSVVPGSAPGRQTPPSFSNSKSSVMKLSAPQGSGRIRPRRLNTCRKLQHPRARSPARSLPIFSIAARLGPR
jgi:hypothetical protein